MPKATSKQTYPGSLERDISEAEMKQSFHLSTQKACSSERQGFTYQPRRHIRRGRVSPGDVNPEGTLERQGFTYQPRRHFGRGRVSPINPEGMLIGKAGFHLSTQIEGTSEEAGFQAFISQQHPRHAPATAKSSWNNSQYAPIHSIHFTQTLP